MYTWRTAPDGRIVVSDGGGPEFIPSYHPGSPDASLVERVEARWGDLCRRIAGRHGLADGWTQSHIKRESKGDPRARNPEKKPGVEDDGVGLLQITNPALKAAYTDEQLQDPEINLEIGCGFLASLVRRYGPNFPRICAAFNAGGIYPPHPGEVTRWGMHAAPGHIDEEVRSLNYYLERGMSEAERVAPLQLSDAERAEILARVLEAERLGLDEDHDRPGGTEPPPHTD